MNILVIDSYNRGLSDYFKEIGHNAQNEISITTGVNYVRHDPKKYDLIFLHCGNQTNWEAYCQGYGEEYTIVLFSGAGVKEGVCQGKKVSVIPWEINGDQDINSLDWEAAFEEFEKNKSKPFPVHLLKTFLQNTCAFLILLQGYIVANLAEGEEKNKLLPGWANIPNRENICKNPQLTKENTWFSVVKKDALIHELKIHNKLANESEKLIELTYANTTHEESDIKSVCSLYPKLKDAISAK